MIKWGLQEAPVGRLEPTIGKLRRLSLHGFDDYVDSW